MGAETGVCIKKYKYGEGINSVQDFLTALISTGIRRYITYGNREGQLYNHVAIKVLYKSLFQSWYGKYILSGSEDKTLQIWDIAKESTVMTFTGHNSQIETVDFSPSGLYCISGSGDGTIKIWDTDKGVCARTLSIHSLAVTGIKFSHDGSSIVPGVR